MSALAFSEILSGS